MAFADAKRLERKPVYLQMNDILRTLPTGGEFADRQ